MMSVESWIVLWKVVFVVGIGMFALLAIVVTIGGARDAVQLLRSLQTEKTSDDPPALENEPQER